MIIVLAILSGSFQDEYTGAQQAMVQSQIAGRGVSNKLVLDAMKKVPRHQFVPDAYKSEAYQDRPLPIGMDQTISQPYIVGFMTEAISPGKEDIVLEIGTGSGYQAAVLAEIVKEVYTLEIIPELGKMAKDRLTTMGYTNVHCRVSDGYHGWQEHAPFDAIIVTAAAEKIPQPLVDQLAEGGRMIIPVGPAFDVQNLVLLTRQKGEIKSKRLFPVRFVPFTRD
ncbi:MAG: protein-L-isoaspartate(D-aspartate) O-methyltransferase [Cyclobacteriaceae bacterium]|nr:protein-L-isoaspartate(D-aspartate) O-methyltransferase [Cyclobacteriaceae bacterium]